MEAIAYLEARRILVIVHKKWKVKLVVVVLILLVGIRLALPMLGKHYLNNYLATDVEQYVGQIADFDLSLWRGAYQIQGLTLKKKATNSPVPFVAITEMDISLSWRALFRGRFLINLVLQEPKLNFTDSKDKEKRQFGVDNKPQTWKELLDTLVPFKLEMMKIHQGQVSFQNNEFKTPVVVTLGEIEFSATNIHNTSKGKENLFSTYEVTALAQKHAGLKSKGKFNILSNPMDFDMSLELEKFNLPELNNLAKMYGPLDITSGELNFYMEMAAYKGALKGYLKPMAKNMDIRAEAREQDDSVKEFFTEILTAITNTILQNGKNKTFATKIPVSGTIKNPRLDIWAAIKLAIKNGFGDPEVKPQVDEEITLKSAIEERRRLNNSKEETTD